MDFAIDVPVQFGPVQLTAALVCIVAVGASLIHAVGQHWAANRNLRLGLEHKRSTFKLLASGFIVFLTVLGLDIVGEFPWPAGYNVSTSMIVGTVSVGMFLGLVGMVFHAWSKHATHHNH